MKNDPHNCERNLSNCVTSLKKISRLHRYLKPSPRDTGAKVWPTELWSHWCWELVNYASTPKIEDVTHCVRLHTLLHVVGSCFAKFETPFNISFVRWSPKRSATKLDLFAQLFQHCWSLVRGLHMVRSKVLWVLSFPRCTAGPKIVGSCCICLHTLANTDATTPNIVGPIMLGVFASVCSCWILHIQPTFTRFGTYR